MKKNLLFIGLMLISTISFSQTLEELQASLIKAEEQNKRLKEKLEFSELFDRSEQYGIKTFHKDIHMKILEVKGNKSNQSVEVTILLTNNIVNQELSLNTGHKKPIAYDEIGNGFEFKESKFPQTYYSLAGDSFKSPTEVPVKGSITFKNILPETEKLSYVTGLFNYRDLDGGAKIGEGRFEIKNLPITWN